MSQYDVVIIGAGPGGYTAAIRASKMGKKVALVEKNAPGGVCLNWGCIPSKNLIHQASQFNCLHEMEGIGVAVDRTSLDYKKVNDISRSVVKTLTAGVSYLLKKNNVDIIKGHAVITNKGEVTVSGGKHLRAKNIIIASGSRPLQVPGFECDEDKVLSSTGILKLTQLPKSLLILGGGAIGCEFAYVMNSFGVKVTLVEAMSQLLPTEDSEVCAVVEACFKQQGIEVLTDTRAVGINKQKDKITTTLISNAREIGMTTEKALVVFGRVPNTEHLGLREMGIKFDERGHIVTQDYGQSSVPGIYAIGDITQSPALAHVATKEGEIVVNHIVGARPDLKKIAADMIPSAIYCEPQVAGFGLREQDAKANDIPFKSSIFNYSGAGKTIAMGKSDGFIKVLCNADTDEILGAHIVGYNATELIHEVLLAKSAELLPVTITDMIHAHPTISEGISEAMAGIYGKQVHG